MEKGVFLRKLADVLQVSPDEINEELELKSENWDSVAMLATIALIDEQFGVTVPTNELKASTSVGMLVEFLQRAVRDASSGT